METYGSILQSLVAVTLREVGKCFLSERVTLQFWFHCYYLKSLFSFLQVDWSTNIGDHAIDMCVYNGASDLLSIFILGMLQSDELLFSNLSYMCNVLCKL